MPGSDRLREGLTRRVAGIPKWARWMASPYPPGHYHSPLPDLAAVSTQHDPTADPPLTLPGIDERLDAQLALLPEFAEYSREMPFGQDPQPGLRYHLDCTWFAHGDGAALYSMLRHIAPRRYVEIGSGWSSACALDTADRFLGSTVEFTFVEPNPQRLRSVLRPSDNANIISDAGTDFAWELFAGLDAGDVLFIDSSHVTKPGSEVNRLFLDVIPQLPPGVNIHVHDIFWPFDYPPRWLAKGRAWNEAYLLRALLCGNPKLHITWFNNFLRHAAPDRVGEALPAWRRDAGSSIWLVTA